MANYLDNFSLQGKVALITGASYGIGFAIAKAMAGAGATIVFNDIKHVCSVTVHKHPYAVVRNLRQYSVYCSKAQQ